MLSLNDTYQGGGTYFEAHDQVVKVPCGGGLIFRGRVERHRGERIEAGVRYITTTWFHVP